MRVSALISAVVLMLPAQVVFGQNATVPGGLSCPYPTVTNLAIDWKIEGDENLNGLVEVKYRRRGEKNWNAAMPLRRVPAGSSIGTRPIFQWENRHSGSIFDLRPGTEYEIALKLTDPDGGSAERKITAKTRPVPKDPGKPRIRKVTLANFKAETLTAHPGDVFILSAGSYGAFKVTQDGTDGKPIVFRSPDGSAIFDSVDLTDRKYVHLEGATVNGSVDLLGGESLIVRRCTIKAKYGIIAKRAPGVKNSYIADNLVTGEVPFHPDRMGVPSRLPAQGEGIQITGPGNVICHNRVKGFHDCISLMEDTNAFQQVSNDIYNNDVYAGVDDAIEADFGMGNCRVLRNRITNCFMGLSSQPSLGGPTYYIRNAMYNILNSPFKLARRSLGNVVLHNTALKVGDGMAAPHQGWGYTLFRNNLCIGGTGGAVFGRYHAGRGRAVSMPGPDNSADLDYDGVGAHGVPFQGILRDVRFQSIEEMRERTQEKHAVQVDMSVFAEGVPFPDPALPERETPDLRLRAGSAAVDAGAVLMNINEAYGGKAPDLGAYELGQDLPIYGPRPAGLDEETTWKHGSKKIRR